MSSSADETLDRILRILRLDELDESERHLLRRREPILAVEDHRVGDVDREDCRARRQVLLFVDFEIFRLESDLVGIAADRVPDRPHAVDGRRVVAELVWPGLRKELAARSGAGYGVVAGA